MTGQAVTLEFADSKALFLDFLEGEEGKTRKLEGGPAECRSGRGGPQEGPEAQRHADLKGSCVDLCLSPNPARRRGGGGSPRAFRRADSIDKEKKTKNCEWMLRQRIKRKSRRRVIRKD